MAHSTNSTGSGRAAELIRSFNSNPTTPPAEIAAAAVSAADPGDRHHTMVAAVVALAEVGLADTEIHDAIFDAYIGHFDTSETGHRSDTFNDAVRWARRRIGTPTSELPQDVLTITETLAREYGW